MKTQSIVRSVSRLGLALSLAFVSVAPSTFGQPLKHQASGPRYVVTDIGSPSDFDFLYRVKLNNRGDVLGDGDTSVGLYADECHSIIYQNGQFTDLHLLTPWAATVGSSLSTDLNDRGQALFRMADPGGAETYFLYDNGRLQDFSQLTGRSDLYPSAMNNARVIVGICGPDETGEAFMYSHGHLRLLGKLPGYPASTAMRISDTGHILGLAMNDAEEKYQAVLFTAHGIVPLGLPGHGMSFGADINKHGDVVGASSINDYSGTGDSWLWQDGRFIPLPFAPTALNDARQVVGTAGPWPHQAYLYSGGTTYNLNDLIDPSSGWRLLEANDINERGQIVGWGRFSDTWRGFLLTPQR